MAFYCCKVLWSHRKRDASRATAVFLLWVVGGGQGVDEPNVLFESCDLSVTDLKLLQNFIVFEVHDPPVQSVKALFPMPKEDSKLVQSSRNTIMKSYFKGQLL